MSKARNNTYLDVLYGDITFADEIGDLIYRPLLQRLRLIRLSNIDSLNMPGISGLSRFEHALGTAYLCTRVGFYHSLRLQEQLLLQAAALIHDTAISPFGHLAEEALQYVETGFNHERKWALLLGGDDPPDTGGIGLQLFLGRQSGLNEWILQTFGTDIHRPMNELFELISGRGTFGKLIAGDMDLDNLDNVTRIAYHMGLDCTGVSPVKLATLMSGVTPSGDLMFSPEAVPLIHTWLGLREAVYARLMLSETDFAGKVMLLYATVKAYEAGVFTLDDWKWNDLDYLTQLSSASDRIIRETTRRWMLGDVWDLSPLLWVEGPLPQLSKLKSFSELVSDRIGREYFAYRIKDKRKRHVRIFVDADGIVELGEDSSQWLLGGGSPTKRSFTATEAASINSVVQEFFGTQCFALGRTLEASLFGS